MGAYEADLRERADEFRRDGLAAAAGGALAAADAKRGTHHRGCLVERIDADGLDAIADDWRDLANRSVEPNALHAVGFVTAGIRLLRDANGFKAAAVWRVTPGGHRLVGVIPFRTSPWRWGLPLGLATGLSHNYSPLGTPLIDASDGVMACEAFLDWLGARGLRQRFLLLPGLPQTGRAAQMLRMALVRSGLTHSAFDPRDHVLAEKRPGSYIEFSISSKKRSQLGWQRRRLDELGTVTMEIATSPGETASAVEDFLRLEAEGWKGRAGTASTQRADRLAFVKQAATSMAADGLARVYLLKLDGRAIASAILFVQGGRGWLWKIAYDETLGRFSPGVQLMVSLTDHLMADPSVSSLDSLAEAPHPMLSHVWRERLTLADWLIDLTPGGSVLMPVAVRAERSRRRLHILARRLVQRLRQIRSH